MKPIYLSAFAIIFACIHSLSAQTISIDSIRKVFPNDDIINLKEKVDIVYSLNDKKELIIKETRNVKLLVLDEDMVNISQLEIGFDEFSTSDFINGRIYTINRQGRMEEVLENLKLRNTIDRDYFISNIFFSDYKLKIIPLLSTLKENTVIDYTYETVYRDPKFLTSIMPTDGYSVASFEVNITTPDFVQADATLHGYFENFNKKDTVVGTNTIKTYTLTNYQQPKRNRLSTPFAYYYPHLIIHTKSYQKNGITVPVIETTQDLYNWYASLIDELKPDKSSIKQLSSSITSGLSRPEDKIQAIFQWVQENITYVAFEDGIAGFKPDEAQRVIQLKYGDCKGMGNLLYELLKAEGFDARHCWIGTKHKPYSYSTPSLTVDNHMVCALRFNGKLYILDGTGKDFKWNVIPPHLEGKEALIGIDKSKFEIVKLPVSNAKDNVIKIDLNVDLAPQAHNVQGSIILTGHHLETFASMKRSIPTERKDRAMENFIDYIFDNAFIISEAKAIETKDGVRIEFKGKDAGLILQNQQMMAVALPKLYTLPMIQVDAKKSTPIEVEFPQGVEIKINISNGNFPAAKKIEEADDYKGIEQSLKVQYTGNDKAQINYKFYIDQYLYMRDEVSKWNQFSSDYFNKYYFIQL